MKMYKPKKWFTVSRMVLLIVSIFLISSSASVRTNIRVVKNDTMDKAISYNTIVEAQETLHQKSLYTPEGSFIGQLTGYAGDCPACSGVVACKPRINVLEKGIYFDDSEYGKIRMVASSKNYPCGTILRFYNKKIQEDPIIAVVMDRGVSGNVIDLLMDNASDARKYVGRIKNLNFDILRLGW